jgi:hypothetical protein
LIAGKVTPALERSPESYMVSLDPRQRYDMPAAFGPSLLSDQEHVPEFEAAVVGFETSPEHAKALLPRYYSVGERAGVSISRMAYRGVGYLGGRGYEELVVSIDAVYDGPDGRTAAPYMLVLWVSESAAIAAGREFMGYPKLFGELPPIAGAGDQRTFICSEFGNPLVSARLSELCALTGEKLERLRAAGAESPGLGWKYIAAPGGGVDADYPTLIMNRFDYREAWSGVSDFAFSRPTAQQAPSSSRVVAALAELPVVKMRRAFLGRGSCIIDRAATRRLRAPISA